MDVTVGLTPEDLERVLAAVEQIDLHPLVPDVKSFVQQTWVLPTLDQTTGLRVDFIFSWTPLRAGSPGAGTSGPRPGISHSLCLSRRRYHPQNAGRPSPEPGRRGLNSKETDPRPGLYPKLAKSVRQGPGKGHPLGLRNRAAIR